MNQAKSTTLWVTISMGLLLLICCCAQVKAAEVNAASLLMMEKQALQTRDVQKKLEVWREEQRAPDSDVVPAPPTDLLKTDFTSLPEGAGSEFFRYYDARLLALSKQEVFLKQAAKVFAELADSKSVAPEALDAFFEVNPPTDRDGRGQKTLALGKLLPLSVSGRSVSSMGTRRYMDAEQPLIPRNKTGRPEQDLTADKYFEMKMYDLAARDYVETIYGSFAPSRLRSWYWESWLSGITAPLWLKAAQAEWQMGHTEVAANYTAKAIVFGSDATKDDALRVLAEWRKNGLPEKPPAPEPDAAKLKQIAQQYAQMNMHPRAIELMKQFAPVIGPDAKMLQAKYEKEWLELVARYCVGTFEGQCVLFGQNVSKSEDRLKVQIPPPLRPAALEKAAETVRQLAAETEKVPQ